METKPQESFIRSSFSKAVTKLGLSILQTAKQPERIKSSGRYLGIAYNTNLQKEAIDRILDWPKVQELLADRPTQEWPSLEQMSVMPEGSLGWCVARRFKELGISFIIDQSKIPETQTDEEYLLTRAIRSHEIHHTLLGLPITVAGEAAASAYYASTLGTTSDIGVLTSWMLRSAYEPSESRLIWDAIGFGIEVGRISPDLFTPRWEDGWEKPITEWQEELGISEILKKSPFNKDDHD